MIEYGSRRFLIGKYSFELGTLIIMISGVLFASWMGLIDRPVTGTLLGSIFGFFGRGIRKIHEK